MKLFILQIVICFCLFGCNEKERNLDYCVIDLGVAINEDKKNNVNLIGISAGINIIIPETNDSILFRDLFIAGIIKDKIIAFDKKRLYSISKTDGAVKIILDHQGIGPEEYKIIIDATILNDSTISIYDTGKRGFLKYK